MKVSFFDGRTVSVPAAESLRSVRTHVAAATGLQANELCFSCAGTLLNDAENHAHVGEWVHKILAAKQASHDDKHRRGADEAASAAMPPVMVWTRRYSRRRSEESEQLEAVRLAKQREHRRQRPSNAREAAIAGAHFVSEHAPLMIDAARRISLRRWAEIGIWITLLFLSSYLQFGVPFLMASAVVAMFRNLGTRNPNEPSAYTVFNHGHAALPGQLQLADFERELLHRPEGQ